MAYVALPANRCGYGIQAGIGSLKPRESKHGAWFLQSPAKSLPFANTYIREALIKSFGKLRKNTK
jgi:hypothetical protein